MKTYQLFSPDRLEPFWFKRVRHKRHPAIVSADETITVKHRVRVGLAAHRFKLPKLPGMDYDPKSQPQNNLSNPLR